MNPHPNRRRALLTLAACAAAPALAAMPASGPAPDFTLKATDGSNLRLAEQRGRVVLLNFWATWCGPCRQEMPHLDRLHAKYRDAGFMVLAVNVDDDSAKAQGVASRLGLKLPLLWDADKQVSRLYDLNTMPATVLIDRDGRVRHLHRGYREGVEALYEQQVRALLKE